MECLSVFRLSYCDSVAVILKKQNKTKKQLTEGEKCLFWLMVTEGESMTWGGMVAGSWSVKLAGHPSSHMKLGQQIERGEATDSQSSPPVHTFSSKALQPKSPTTSQTAPLT
jgi:hypothetical protein